MMPPVELNRKGFKALVDALGYTDAIRFIRQYNNGSGDYTKERHQWLDQSTVEDIFTQIEQAREKDSSDAAN